MLRLKILKMSGHDRPNRGLRAREGGKTTLKLNVDGVPVRITAKHGEMRIVADVDFTQYDMARIDEAIRTALRALEG